MAIVTDYATVEVENNVTRALSVCELVICRVVFCFCFILFHKA